MAKPEQFERMSPSLPIRFDSTTSPGRYTYYTFLKCAMHTSKPLRTVQYCYGAGGSSREMNRYQDFLSSHPGLSLLCVDRWCQGMDPSEGNILEALSHITAELLQHLDISSLSLAAHSAGIYQALDLATRYSNLIDTIFPMCAHVPAQLTTSKALTLMTRAPEAVLRLIGRIDAMNPPDYVRTVIGLPSNVGDDTLVVVQTRDKQVRARSLSRDEQLMRTHRRELDYSLCYQHLATYSGDYLLNLYTNCPRPLVWFTTIQDKFFGPTTVQRVLDLRPGIKSAMTRIDDAHHANIFLKRDVWEALYGLICS